MGESDTAKPFGRVVSLPAHRYIPDESAVKNIEWQSGCFVML